MKTILVVEDESDVRSTIREVLESENYRVLTAQDGKEGYDLAIREQPDMILSDIKMPITTGLEMFDMLQKHKSFNNTPFLFLSAKVDLADIRRGMARGADDYITKPFTVQDLLNAVELRFKKKSSMLTELEEMRENLVMRIPHELRTPLVGILGLSELISEDIDSFSKEDLIEMTQNIHQTGKRLHNIIEKYIFYAGLLSIENDKKERENILASSHEVTPILDISNMMREMDKPYRAKDIQIDMDTVKIAMSELYFGVIIKELLENAVKFSDDGAPVRLRCKVFNNKYEVGIEDLGIGMLETALDQIKSFRQFNPNRYQYNGIGLGLATVKKILEYTNSKMVIKSKYGGGTLVKVSIPLADSNEYV